MSSIDPAAPPAEGRTYWQSLAELADSKDYLEFVKAEFPEGVDLPPESAGRRRFLQVMAASIALAGTTGCRWPKENIRPFAKRPEGLIPGKPVYFATSMDLGGVSRGLLVKSYDGRPIHVEGNDLDPISKGSADSQSIASVLDLYDPDRSRTVLKNGAASNWSDLESSLSTKLAQFAANRGAGLRFLVEASSSPSRARLQRQIQVRFPQAGWVEYESLSADNIRLGTRIAYGSDLRPQYDLARAAVIVDLEADLLSTSGAAARNARGYAEGRDPENESFNRLYSIESGFSITGAAADHRFALRSAEIYPVLAQLAAALSEAGLAFDGEMQSILEAAQSTASNGKTHPFTLPLAKDLIANRGRSIIAVGANQPPAAHALAVALNEALGNVGETISWTREPDSGRPSHFEGIRELAGEMSSGAVDTLVVIGGNPVYDAPSDLDFPGLYEKVDLTIHLSQSPNETSQASNWCIPRAHYLETWSDGRLYDGTLCAGQPLIAPLYDGKSDLELLAFFLDETFTPGHEIVRTTFQEDARGNFEVAWREFLDRGLLPASDFVRALPTLDPASVAAAVRETAPLKADGLEVVFSGHPSIYDGRFANNGWLQEVPDFMTKLTWDNAAIVSLADARTLGVEFGDVIRIETPAGSVETPVYLLPGQAEGSIALHLGYGRTAAGRVGDNVGVNVQTIRTSTSPYLVAGVSAKKTGIHYPLSSTQDHYAIEAGAKNSLEPLGAGEVERRIDLLIREKTLEEHRHPHDHDHGHAYHPPIVSPWTEWEYNELKWGMAIDLNKCIGCNGCVVACQSENNIPVVGKEQVGKGREMHWLRIDRYFHGAPETAQVAHQPVTCHHCENAPCEQVCPVGATMHDHDGLNVMVYNRCIGTRYCSNNCPYKVRRFNWFNFTKDYSEVEQMVFNPEVTIRSRGVMEKCTYCVQRIQAARIESRNENRPIADGEVRTACQQACPTQAIAFGDLNDPESRVAKLHQDDRAYFVLEELNVKPRTKYLTRLRNPNPELLEA